MPKSMPEDVSKVVVDALERGLTRGQISGVVGISKRAITRISSNLKKHGTAKAPPSGAKLGRPVKLNKAQADAMIVWMAEREHTFYVKDLVEFLREQYKYKGCDGTIRRCLIRAGYRRKLVSRFFQTAELMVKPWHKSEMTHWIPPDYRPSFTTSSRSKRTHHPPAPAANAETALEALQAESKQAHERQSRSTHEAAIHDRDEYFGHSSHVDPGIDPSLETHDQHQQVVYPYQQETVGTSFSLDDSAHYAYRPAEGEDPAQAALHLANPGSAQPLSISHGQQDPPLKGRQARKATKRMDPQFSTLQSELAQKDAVIAQLQQQLANHQSEQQTHAQQALLAQLTRGHSAQSLGMGEHNGSHGLSDPHIHQPSHSFQYTPQY